MSFAPPLQSYNSNWKMGADLSDGHDMTACTSIGTAAENLSAIRDMGISTDRLRELAEADKDGLCVVLPCKVGDAVSEALFEWDCTECLKTSFKPKVRERKVTHFMLGKSGDIILGVAGDGADYLVYGKTVFRTRAEAEEALKGGTA